MYLYKGVKRENFCVCVELRNESEIEKKNAKNTRIRRRRVCGLIIFQELEEEKNWNLISFFFITFKYLF